MNEPIARTERAYFRLSTREIEILKHKAKKRKRSISDYLRCLIILDDLDDRLWLFPEKDNSL